MEGITKIKESELVLKVKSNYDPSVLNLSEWDNYLDILCGVREYQKQAIKTAIIYLASGYYKTITQLAKENYSSNSSLREKYKRESDFLHQLPLPDKLSGVIDLATGTGKSYVMFGIAQIMLSLRIVERVLLLCPSVTIENELTKKFKMLSNKKELKEAIPSKNYSITPSIIDASSTISAGDICIENIHAIYDNTATSIKDSFASGGQDTLVLSDEVHHAYNSSNEQDIRKWKEFLSSKYNFLYMLGFTGTAYTNNEYFSDVIYRYSLRQAIEDKVVKSIEYVAKDDKADKFEKFQMIYDNHLEMKRKYSPLKPVSIFISKDIKSATYLFQDFLDFLVDTKKVERSIAEDMAIVVTSSPKHRNNVLSLPTVEDSNNPVEWIFSVSMLTEGWDVKQVFQIVPWEDRAFNSKLLIAQVLGRGLRVPENFTIQPKVRVFNHASWSKSIQTLVDEVLELELELKSRIITDGEPSKFNFDIYTVNYSQEEQAVEKNGKKQQEIFDLTKGIILISQTPEDKKITEYEDIGRNTYQKTTVVMREMIAVDKVVDRIVESFRGRALEAKLVFPDGEYERENLPSVDVIRKYIYDSMRSCGIKGDYLTAENANKIYGKFTGLLRRKPATPLFSRKGDAIELLSTLSIRSSSKSFSTLTKDVTIFISNNYEQELLEDELQNYLVVKEEIKTKQIREINAQCFKTPLNIVFALFEPERRFVELLVGDGLSPHIDSWIKSRDTGFYGIEYQINKGSAFQTFNPDFFICVGKNVIVVETKSDDDASEMNCAKYKAAKRHFELLNKTLAEQGSPWKYFFYFLSPVDYNVFADYISDGRLFTSTFHSKLMDLLEKKIESLDESP